jgi:predicted amidohydrolase YtcJ
MILVDGKVVSVDDRGYNENPGRIYEGMAVKRDRIMALGTSREMRALADSNTSVIDLMGQTVIPGIIESHVHLYGDPAELARRGIPTPPRKGIRVGRRRTRNDPRLVQNAIRDEVKTLQEGDWLLSIAETSPTISARRVVRGPVR